MTREEIGKLADIVIQNNRISAALEKQKPMKPYIDNLGGKFCPICLERAAFQMRNFGLSSTMKMKFCQDCGQAIDWSEE